MRTEGIVLAVVAGLALAAPALARPAKVARELAACTSYANWRHHGRVAKDASETPEKSDKPEKKRKREKVAKAENGEEPAVKRAKAEKPETGDKPRIACKTIPQGEIVEVIDPDAGEGSATIQWRGKAWYVDGDKFDS